LRREGVQRINEKRGLTRRSDYVDFALKIGLLRVVSGSFSGISLLGGLVNVGGDRPGRAAHGLVTPA
jgi:hypothetical protein